MYGYDSFLVLCGSHNRMIPHFYEKGYPYASVLNQPNAIIYKDILIVGYVIQRIL